MNVFTKRIKFLLLFLLIVALAAMFNRQLSEQIGYSVHLMVSQLGIVSPPKPLAFAINSNKKLDNDVGMGRLLMVDREYLQSFLQGKNVIEKEFLESLLRLAKAKDPVALKVGIELISSDSSRRRQAAAYTLGHFDADHQLHPLIVDSNTEVRLAAMKSLGYLHSKKRKQYILKLLSATPDPNLARLTLLNSLFLNDRHPSNIQIVLKELAKFIQECPPELTPNVLSVMLWISPRDPITTETLIKTIAKNKNVKSSIIALSTLSRQQNPWVKTKINKLVTHPNYEIRKTAIANIFKLNLEDPWPLLYRVKQQEIDEELITEANRQAILLGGPKSRPFIQFKVEKN